MISCLFCGDMKVLKKVFFEKPGKIQLGEASGSREYLLKYLCRGCVSANFRIQTAYLLEGVNPNESDLKKHARQKERTDI